MPSHKRQATHKLHQFHAAQDYAASWCLDIDLFAANHWQARPADKAALARRDFAALSLSSLNRLLAALFDEIECLMPTEAELRAMCNPVIDPTDPLNDVTVPF